MYNIKYDSEAEKFLRRAAKGEVAKFKLKIESVAADPFARIPNVLTIKGGANTFRLRVGGWRVVYDVDTTSKTIVVWRIRPRGAVYKP